MPKKSISSDFASQYNHPLWQKKRLEALEFYGFKCGSCESQDKQLHVHHRRYIKGKKIWEYGLGNFDVLCHECHEHAHNDKDLLNLIIGGVNPENYMDCSVLISCFSTESESKEIIDGFNTYDKTLLSISSLAFKCCYNGKEFNHAVMKILSLAPSRLIELAKKVD